MGSVFKMITEKKIFISMGESGENKLSELGMQIINSKNSPLIIGDQQIIYNPADI